MTKRARLQLDVSPARLEQIDRLVERLGLDGRREVFNTALSLLSWAEREVAEGRAICSVAPDGTTKELYMPGFDEARKIVPLRRGGK